MEQVEYDQARAMLSIDPDDLEQEFTQAPEILSFFVNKYADALQRYLKARMFFEQTEARLKIGVREYLTSKARKQYSEDCQIEDENVSAAKQAGRAYKRREVKLHSVLASEVDQHVLKLADYTEAREAYIAAEAEMTRLKGWCDVARVKRDMLTNLGMRVNAELRGAGWTPSSHQPTQGTRAAEKPMPRKSTDPPF